MFQVHKYSMNLVSPCKENIRPMEAILGIIIFQATSLKWFYI